MPPKRPTSPLSLASSSVPAKKPHVEEDVLTTLRTKYPTSTALESQLSKLDATELRGLLLSVAYPETAKQFQHCIYCHTTFNTAEPEGCEVKHFGGPEQGEFTCCGLRYEEEEYGDEEWMEPVEEREPHCFTGKHSVIPWKAGDMEVRDDDYDFFEEENEDEARMRKRWWEEIVKVQDCEKLKCGKERTL